MLQGQGMLPCYSNPFSSPFLVIIPWSLSPLPPEPVEMDWPSFSGLWQPIIFHWEKKNLDNISISRHGKLWNIHVMEILLFELSDFFPPHIQHWAKIFQQEFFFIPTVQFVLFFQKKWGWWWSLLQMKTGLKQVVLWDREMMGLKVSHVYSTLIYLYMWWKKTTL